MIDVTVFFFFSSRRRHTRWTGDWSSDVCSSDLKGAANGDVAERVGDSDTTITDHCWRMVKIAPEWRVYLLGATLGATLTDRKSTRLNSTHPSISYAVFCLKKKKQKMHKTKHQQY